LEPNDVIERYKEVKAQVDHMDEEEISALAERVATVASTMDDPDDRVARNVVSFFEQEKISPEARHLGIRLLTSNMAGKLVSEKLAILLAYDLDKLPQSFWEQDDDNKDSKVIGEINTCNDLAELTEYMRRSDFPPRVRRAAAIRAAEIATTKEKREQYTDMANALAPKRR